MPSNSHGPYQIAVRASVCGGTYTEDTSIAQAIPCSMRVVYVAVSVFVLRVSVGGTRTQHNLVAPARVGLTSLAQLQPSSSYAQRPIGHPARRARFVAPAACAFRRCVWKHASVMSLIQCNEQSWFVT